MHLPPPAAVCCVSGRRFPEGARVVSMLVRPASLEVVRHDLLEERAGEFDPPGFVACRWVHLFKPRTDGASPQRALKLTAENLFLTLADPDAELTPENVRLVQFLALLLERKKLLRPRGRTADGERNVFEHTKTKQLFEVAAGELTSAFFLAVQQQLGVLVGVRRRELMTPRRSHPWTLARVIRGRTNCLHVDLPAGTGGLRHSQLGGNDHPSALSP